jgi:hypothetical protein
MPPIFTSKMDCYAIWATSLFLQASMKILFRRITIVRWQDILALRKMWSFYKNNFIGQNFDRTSTIISYLALFVPFLSHPSRSKDYTPLFLLPRGLGNPSRWNTCLVFRPQRKALIAYLWWFIGFQR